VKDLVHHFSKEHQTAPTPKFRCTKCPNEFGTNADLNKHLLRIHSGDRPKLKCRDCLKEFSVMKHLALHVKRNHRKSQAEADRLKCHFCNFSSDRTAELERHQTAKHPTEKLLLVKSNPSKVDPTPTGNVSRNI
jgi:hypothetical protein